MNEKKIYLKCSFLFSFMRENNSINEIQSGKFHQLIYALSRFHPFFDEWTHYKDIALINILHAQIRLNIFLQ